MSQQLEINNFNSADSNQDPNQKESSLCCKCWQWKRMIILVLLLSFIIILVFGLLLYVSFHSNEPVEVNLMVAYGCAFIGGLAVASFMCGCLCKDKVKVHSSVQPI